MREPSSRTPRTQMSECSLAFMVDFRRRCPKSLQLPWKSEKAQVTGRFDFSFLFHSAGLPLPSKPFQAGSSTPSRRGFQYSPSNRCSANSLVRDVPNPWSPCLGRWCHTSFTIELNLGLLEPCPRINNVGMGWLRPPRIVRPIKLAVDLGPRGVSRVKHLSLPRAMHTR